MKESNVVFMSACGKFFVTSLNAAGLRGDGYAVWENVGTHAKLKARIGFSGSKGLERAKAEIEKRGGTL